MQSGSAANGRYRSWNSLIASATPDASATLTFCDPTAAGTARGRHTHPAVRLGFKPRRGRQALPGRFDSCCLPPSLAVKLARVDCVAECGRVEAVDPFSATLPIRVHKKRNRCLGRTRQCHVVAMIVGDPVHFPGAEQRLTRG